MSPLGIGFIGSDPDGLYHYQRLQLRDDVRCLPERSAYTKSASEKVESAIGQSGSEILQDPQISIVWTAADDRLETARRILQAGKKVLLGLPAGISEENWAALLSTLPHGQSLYVAALHRWSGQFRTVQSQVQSAGLGQLLALRRISRQYVPQELDSEANQRRSFDIKWLEMLDELLLLVNLPVQTVWAKRTPGGRAAWITFTDGCQAFLELDRRCLAPLETGWILEGTEGGYAAGRRYRASSDHELVEVPVDFLPTDQTSTYDALVASVNDGIPFPVTTESITRAMNLRDAIEASLSTGREVQLP